MTDIALLIKKYLKDELNEQERRELEAWKDQSDVNRQIFDELTDDEYLVSAVGDAYKIDSDIIAREKIHARIYAQESVQRTTTIKAVWFRIATAAAILVVVTVGVLYFFKKN